MATPDQIYHRFDPYDSLDLLGRPWGTPMWRAPCPNPRTTFWSLAELERWVEESCEGDVYLSPDENNQYRFATFNWEVFPILTERLSTRKEHRISGKGDSLLIPEIKSWLADNIAGEHDLIEPVTMMGAFNLELYCRQEEDATLFHVRWRGHGALTLDE